MSICTRLTRFRGHESSEAGFSLIEMMVVIIMLGMIGTLVTTFAISAITSNSSSQVLVGNTEGAQNALDAMGRAFGAATDLTTNATGGQSQGFTITAPNEAQFYAYDKSSTSGYLTVGPSLYDFSVVQSPIDPSDFELQQTITTAVGTGAPWTYTTAPSVKILAHGLANPATAPALFTYYQPQYSLYAGAVGINGVQACASPSSVPATAPVTAANGGPAWVGYQAGYLPASAVNTVNLTVTVTGNGQGGATYTRHATSTSLSQFVTLFTSNSSDSRAGTCL